MRNVYRAAEIFVSGRGAHQWLKTATDILDESHSEYHLPSQSIPQAVYQPYRPLSGLAIPVQLSSK